MDAASAFAFAHPFWIWIAIGAVFLVSELSTGSGWLLWPAGSAAAVAVLNLVVHIGFLWQAVIFAVVGIIATYVGRRYLTRASAKPHEDINDRRNRVIGKHGEAAATFKDGLGRVFVDGKEWSAELDGEGALAAKDKVEVVALVGGARLKVRPL
ncbi:MAG: NfeD family protein [Caulobacterales bacterium]